MTNKTKSNDTNETMIWCEIVCNDKPQSEYASGIITDAIVTKHNAVTQLREWVETQTNKHDTQLVNIGNDYVIIENIVDGGGIIAVIKSYETA